MKIKICEINNHNTDELQNPKPEPEHVKLPEKDAILQTKITGKYVVKTENNSPKTRKSTVVYYSFRINTACKKHPENQARDYPLM